MIVINRQYLDRFKPYFDYYIYYVKPGTFLAFNKETLEYISFLYINYIPWKNESNLMDEKLNELLTSGILEIQ